MVRANWGANRRDWESWRATKLLEINERYDPQKFYFGEVEAALYWTGNVLKRSLEKEARWTNEERRLKANVEVMGLRLVLFWSENDCPF